MRLDKNLGVIPPKGVKAQRDFILRVLEEGQEDFRRIMYEMAIEDPKSYAKLYKELSAMVVPKQQELNVSLSLNKDFQELQALASTGSRERIGGETAGLIESVEYETLDEG